MGMDPEGAVRLLSLPEWQQRSRRLGAAVPAQTP
jgi:hypothetical protein